MTERAALYARVSTARQEQEQTVASQVAALERTASSLGVSVPSERRYIDEGVSGARLDRPALDALRDAAADGLIDLVLIYCPDRLARNYVHQHVPIEELTRRGVALHFVERPLSDRAEDRLLVQMQCVIAEYERAKIIERTRRGKIHKLRTGQMLPYGPVAPYGYAILSPGHGSQRVVVIDEIEAEHVRAMYRWVLEDGLSARGVSKRLNALGVRPRRATLWMQGTIYNILINPAYVGQASYNRREPREPKRPRRPGAYRKNTKSSCRLRPPSGSRCRSPLSSTSRRSARCARPWPGTRCGHHVTCSISICSGAWWCAASAAGVWNVPIRRGRAGPTSTSTTPAAIITLSRRVATSWTRWSGTRWLLGFRVHACSCKRSTRGVRVERAPHS